MERFFQQYSLFPWLTVLKNVIFGLKLKGMNDAQTRTQLQSELIKTWQEEKKTCFFITHDVEEAVILATKVIIMSARPGRIKKIVDINLPYLRTQEMKMELPFLDFKTYIWGEVYQEYLEVRK